MAPFQWFVVAVCAWLHREQTDRGYTRIRGALKNLGHRVGRSTICAHPARGRPSARSAAPHDLAHVSSGALAGTRGGGFLHRRSLDGPRIGDVLRGVPPGRAVAADSDDRVHAVPERGVRHSMSTVSHWRDGTVIRRTDSAVRSRSEMEQGRRAVARHRRSACCPDAALRAELQRVRGAVCPVGERGMPEPDRTDRRAAPAQDPARIRHALLSRAKSPGTRERADRTLLRNDGWVPFAGASESAGSSTTTSG